MLAVVVLAVVVLAVCCGGEYSDFVSFVFVGHVQVVRAIYPYTAQQVRSSCTQSWVNCCMIRCPNRSFPCRKMNLRSMKEIYCTSLKR